MKNIAVILAAGSGKRLNKFLPKQFIRIGGQMIIEHVLLLFNKCEKIDSIVVVCQKDKIDFINHLAKKLQITKPLHVIEGGKERMDSTNNAIKYLKTTKVNDSDNILIHDSARPFLSLDIIENCIKALKKYEAIDVVTETKDTIVEVDSKGFLVNIPKRANLRLSQTPQAFKFGILKKAFLEAYKKENSHLMFTDDCGIVMNFLPEVKIMTVNGSDINIKVTTKQDLVIADRLLRLNNSEYKIGSEDLKKLAGKLL